MSYTSTYVTDAVANGNIILDFVDACRNELSFSPVSDSNWLALVEAIQRVDDCGDRSDLAIDMLIHAIDMAYGEADLAMFRDQSGRLAEIWSAVKSNYPADEDFWSTPINEDRGEWTEKLADCEADWQAFCDEVLGDESAEAELRRELWEANGCAPEEAFDDEPDVPDPDAYLEDLCAESLIPDEDHPWDGYEDEWGDVWADWEIEDLRVEINELYNAGYMSDEEYEELLEVLDSAGGEDGEEVEVEMLNCVVKELCVIRRRV